MDGYSFRHFNLWVCVENVWHFINLLLLTKRRKKFRGTEQRTTGEYIDRNCVQSLVGPYKVPFTHAFNSCILLLDQTYTIRGKSEIAEIQNIFVVHSFFCFLIFYTLLIRYIGLSLLKKARWFWVTSEMRQLGQFQKLVRA